MKSVQVWIRHRPHVSPAQNADPSRWPDGCPQLVRCSPDQHEQHEQADFIGQRWVRQHPVRTKNERPRGDHRQGELNLIAPITLSVTYAKRKPVVTTTLLMQRCRVFYRFLFGEIRGKYLFCLSARAVLFRIYKQNQAFSWRSGFLCAVWELWYYKLPVKKNITEIRTCIF